MAVTPSSWEPVMPLHMSGGKGQGDRDGGGGWEAGGVEC